MLGSQAWVAKGEGYFEKNRVDATVQMFGTGAEAIQAVIARQADLGHALDFAVLNFVAAADRNVSIVGAVAQPNPGFHSLAASRDITVPADLKDKKIGHVEGTSQHFVTIEYLLQNNIAVDDVELVSLPGLFELVGALKTGRIDAAWVWLNGTTEAQNDPELHVLANDAVVLDTVAIYLIAETQWAEPNVETITQVLRSYQLASEYIANNYAQAAAIIAEATGGDAAVFENALRDQNHEVGLNQTMLDSLDTIAAFLIDLNVLDTNFDVRDFIKPDAMLAIDSDLITADIE